MPDIDVEKLIFDRALEMSRAAAVDELMGEGPNECEVAYETALWMLYAIIDPAWATVKDQDRSTVDKCAWTGAAWLTRVVIASIQGRLEALRRKLRER